MNELKTHYDILGLAEAAGEEAVKQAYRRLAKQWHPDVCNDPQAETRFKEIDRAYRVLSDPLERLCYDEQLWQQRYTPPPREDPYAQSPRPKPASRSRVRPGRTGPSGNERSRAARPDSAERRRRERRAGSHGSPMPGADTRMGGIVVAILVLAGIGLMRGLSSKPSRDADPQFDPGVDWRTDFRPPSANTPNTVTPSPWGSNGVNNPSAGGRSVEDINRANRERMNRNMPGRSPSPYGAGSNRTSPMRSRRLSPGGGSYRPPSPGGGSYRPPSPGGGYRPPSPSPSPRY